MAASEDGSSCLVSRGRSQSDPSFLSDSSATSTDAGENPETSGHELRSRGKFRASYSVMVCIESAQSLCGEERKDSKGVRGPDLFSVHVPTALLSAKVSVYVISALGRSTGYPGFKVELATYFMDHKIRKYYSEQLMFVPKNLIIMKISMLILWVLHYHHLH
ncbi:phosphatase and actin regulator 3 [Cricetulus griseus]|nr:phosphatase and actin regulator 3 [Cricetulus griseus]